MIGVILGMGLRRVAGVCVFGDDRGVGTGFTRERERGEGGNGWPKVVQKRRVVDVGCV